MAGILGTPAIAARELRGVQVCNKLSECRCMVEDAATMNLYRCMRSRTTCFDTNLVLSGKAHKLDLVYLGGIRCLQVGNEVVGI